MKKQPANKDYYVNGARHCRFEDTTKLNSTEIAILTIVGVALGTLAALIF